jgi:hypothetical protein
VQLTTDGHNPYMSVEDAFGADIDCAVLQKILAGMGADAWPAGKERQAAVTDSLQF